MRKPDISGLKDSLADAARWVEAGLSGLSMRREPLSRLPSLAAYSLESGGKRVRPFLVSAACRAVGGQREVSLSAACAVEMVHTYSLVHDDLPAMDDDSLRRGMPTLHVKCGEAQALLAGDLLLVEAFGEILQTPLGPGRVSEMVRRLAAAAGPGFLVGGQYMDMYHPEDAGEEWIRRMILGKTAAMIRVSLELGVLAGGAGDDMVERISTLGDRLGFLFQLTDDILDRCGSREEMGKEVCKDREQGKRNLLSMMDVDSASERARKMGDEIALDIMELSGGWDDVAALARYLPVRRK